MVVPRGVALPQVAHALGEAGAVIADTRHHVVEDLSRPISVQPAHRSGRVEQMGQDAERV